MKKKLLQVFTLQTLKPNPPMEVKALALSVAVLARAKLWLFSWALSAAGQNLASMVKIHCVNLCWLKWDES